MKRLLIDINSIVPYYVTGKVNGIGRTTLELIQALARIKNLPFEVVLYSQNMKGIGGRNTGLPFKTKHLYLPHREKIDKLLARFPIKECLTGYDIMHIPHNFEYVYSPGKCVVTLHDALFMKIQEKAFGHEKMKQIVPPFMRQCKHIITCSESSRRDIVETMGIEPEKITVIYWGIKHDLFFPQKDKLNIRDKLQSKFELSSPSDGDLALLYNGAEAMFFPSSYEGFGLPLLEAMACGVPVITCHNSSLDEIAGNAAIYLTEPLFDSLIDVMGRLDQNTIDTEPFVENGIKRAAQFSWEKTAKETIGVYLDALK